jgi:hypothetical protein
MIEAIKFWNEPNNQSHWDFHIDPDWSEFAHMTKARGHRGARLVSRIPACWAACRP